MEVEMEHERAETDAKARMKEAMERARAEQARMQEVAQQQHVKRVVPGVNMLGDSFAFGVAAQLQDDGKCGHEPNFPKQDGAVDYMLNSWDEDANESMNLFAIECLNFNQARFYLNTIPDNG
ncbi:hypothetical protein L7F22_053258 [Adiantum nelumboides]|nr:hypothetical protein [Adiantum nelumboides]